MKLSILVAAFNEKDNLTPLYEQTKQVLDDAGLDDFELIIVDDHSTDSTPQVIQSLIERDPRVKTVRFSRNFGGHTALLAGLDHSTGDFVTKLAGDLQDPPDIIPKLLEKMTDEVDVVWAYRASYNVRQSKQLFSRIYRYLFRKYAMPETYKTGADLFLLRRKVVETITQMRERNSNVFALILWAGFRQTAIPYDKAERHAGKSKHNLSRKLKLMTDSFTAFSTAPIRLISLLGVSVAFAGFVFASYLVIVRMLSEQMIPGYAATMVAILVLSGMQMLMLGIVAEYLWRTFDEARGRPKYIVERTTGFDSSDEDSGSA